MKAETCEGIVLRSVGVQEGKRILTVFSPQEGLLSLAAPKVSIHEMRQNAATTLLSRSEFCMRKGRSSDIYRLVEATLLESFDSLRNQFSHLSAAGDLLHLILRTQLSGKPAPLLYNLFLAYLRRLSASQHPHLLVLSFQLKLLKHEGLFSWSPNIPSSLQELAEFSRDDWHCAGILSGSRSFSEIESAKATPFLGERIRTLFEKLIR